MIVVEDVYKRYQTNHGPGKWVLEGVSFAIPLGLSVGVIGSNGAGKSTLLRLIGGIDFPSRGRVERYCRVSWPMGLGTGLQGSLTGRQNAKFVCRIHGYDNVAEKLAYVEDFAELGSAFDEPVKTYSSGMRSRLQFALSLAFDFDVYISDEITAVGDNAFREKAAAAFRRLADHASIIMVSHMEATLRQFCSAGIWLDQGKAYWFDDINDALREYKKSQLSNQLNELMSRPSLFLQEQQKAEIERIKRSLFVLDIVERGLHGDPEMLSHEEGTRILQEARQLGMLLLTQQQIAQQGYTLKPGVRPLLKKYFAAPHNTYLDIFDLHSQAQKAEAVS